MVFLPGVPVILAIDGLVKWGGGEGVQEIWDQLFLFFPVCPTLMSLFTRCPGSLGNWWAGEVRGRWGVQEEWGWLFILSVLLLICLTQVFHASVLCDPLALRLALGAWWVGRMRGIRRGRCSFLPLLVCLLCASSSEPCKVPSLCRKLAAGKGSDGVRLNQSVELNQCITVFNFHCWVHRFTTTVLSLISCVFLLMRNPWKILVFYTMFIVEPRCLRQELQLPGAGESSCVRHERLFATEDTTVFVVFVALNE